MTGTSNEYAIALFGLSTENNCEADVYDGLMFVKDVFEQTPELYAFLKSPGIPKTVRMDVIKRAFSDELPEYVMSFLSLICEHGDAGLIPECVKEYERLYGESFSISRATVRSAVELTADEKGRLYDALEKRFNKRLELEYVIDPAILAGVIIDIDGTRIDGSVKHRLEAMKEVMEK